MNNCIQELEDSFDSIELRKNLDCKEYTHCASLKYSFNVVLNFFEYLTNSFFLCSTACFADVPGMNGAASLTASNSRLMALAISLIEKK